MRLRNPVGAGWARLRLVGLLRVLRVLRVLRMLCPSCLLGLV